MVSQSDQHAPGATFAPIRTLIVDDEKLARSLLSALVTRDPELELIDECSNGAAALNSIQCLAPDLVLLDIQMPVLDGIKVAERLASIGKVPYLIFVTAYDEYAIRAFELNVLDYLVKPIEKQRFTLSIERAKHAIRQSELCNLTQRILALGQCYSARSEVKEAPQSVIIRHGDNLVDIPHKQIVWLEAANQYVNIHADDGVYMVTDNLGGFSRRLADPNFVRIHRSAVVNGERVRSVRKRANGTHVIVLDSGHKLSLARARKDLVPVLLRLSNHHG